MHAPSPAVAAVFEPVQTATTFEETVERLGTAIRLGLLAPGERLPPERDLADQLGIARSTLRQALTTLTQSGHLTSVRGRTGGTFVAEAPPMAEGGSGPELGRWRDLLDYRVAIECGSALLAAERATPEALARLDEQVAAMAGVSEDFPAYRRADVFFHLGVAEAARSPRLVSAMTEIQGGMSDLIAHIPHPPRVLEHANAQHAKLVTLLRAGDRTAAVRLVREHVEGTEHILAGLMP
jgi:GntR family transcriptional regulator, transcriptional repressor for pyruvate dehydrogenase complex